MAIKAVVNRAHPFSWVVSDTIRLYLSDLALAVEMVLLFEYYFLVLGERHRWENACADVYVNVITYRVTQFNGNHNKFPPRSRWLAVITDHVR